MNHGGTFARPLAAIFGLLLAAKGFCQDATVSRASAAALRPGTTAGASSLSDLTHLS